MHKHLAVFTLFVLSMFFTACGDDVAHGIDDTVDAGMDTGMDAGFEPIDPDDFAKCEGNWVQNSACDTSDDEPGFCNSQGCCLPCVEYPVSEYPQTATACEDACVSDDDCDEGFCGIDHRCRGNANDGDDTDDPDMGTTEDTGSDDRPDTGTDDDADNGTSDTGSDDDCTGNQDCADGELCLVDGSCYDPTVDDTFTFCNTDADCVDGETCSSQGLCLLEDEEPDVVFPDMLDACPDQHTCADEETCTSQGYCVPDVFIDLCSSNADCGDDETCNTQGLCLIESDGDGGGGNSNGNDIDIHPHDQSTLDECPDDHTCGAWETCSSQGICLPGFQTCPDQHTCAPDEVCTSQGFCFPDNNSGDGDVDAGMSDAGTDSGSGDLDMGTVDASSDVGTTDMGTDTGQSTDVTVDSGDSGTNDTSTTDSGSDTDADTGADVGFDTGTDANTGCTSDTDCADGEACHISGECRTVTPDGDFVVFGTTGGDADLFALDLDLSVSVDKVCFNAEPVMDASSLFTGWPFSECRTLQECKDAGECESDANGITGISYRHKENGLVAVRFNATLCSGTNCGMWLCEGHTDSTGAEMKHITSADASYDGVDWNVDPTSAPGGPGNGCSLVASSP